MNGYRNDIIKIFNSAKNNLKIAVSWFTDEFLVNKLIEKLQRSSIDLQIVLSPDEYNLFRYKEFRKLISLGAKVHKTGSVNALEGYFMHNKLIIVDNQQAFGGSYNFTYNARTNHENFDEYKNPWKHIRHFQSITETSYDFFQDVVNPEVTIKKLIEEFRANEPQKLKAVKHYYQDNASSNDYPFKTSNTTITNLSEKDIILGTEIYKTEKEQSRKKLVQNKTGISNTGAITTAGSSIKTKTHRFYGGSLVSKRLKRLQHPKAFHNLYLQKLEIEEKYDFLKCRIEDKTLICNGTIQPPNCSPYRIRIIYRLGTFPRVYILDPDVEVYNDIHIYKEGALCLFFPGDMRWKATTSVAEYTIPWIFEWIMCYELWILTGEWKSPFVEH